MAKVPKGTKLFHNSEDPHLKSLLQVGQITDCRPIRRSSNYTLLAVIDDEANHSEIKAVYKPQVGEAPLWDFPSGTLYKRERAAYLLSQALGWPPIPITVIREGPYGTGSLQLFIEAVSGASYFTLREEKSSELCRFFVFDCLTNNADRKGGHCLLDKDGHLWSIDHGLTFHHVPKMRTVIWDFCGEPLPKEMKREISQLAESISKRCQLLQDLSELLLPQELQALRNRIQTLLDADILPVLDPAYSIPWPLE